MIKISPFEGVINPNIIPIEVVFPHPLGPSKPKVLFLSISKLMSLTAIVDLKFFERFFTSNFIYKFDACFILSLIAIPEPLFGILQI